MRLALALVLATTVFVAPALAQEGPPPGLITINGLGEVTAEPDMAIVMSGVVTDADTARAALDANTRAMAGLFEVLRDAGIEERDIQTSGFSVEPKYVQSDRRDAQGYRLPPVIAGYRVSNAVTVRVRDLDNLGRVLDRSVTVGANSISGVAFALAEPGGLLDEARRLAVADAIARAELMTGAAGVGLGRIRSISEQSAPRPQPMADMARLAVSAESAVPVAAGELSYTATVSIQWEIAQ